MSLEQRFQLAVMIYLPITIISIIVVKPAVIMALKTRRPVDIFGSVFLVLLAVIMPGLVVVIGILNGWFMAYRPFYIDPYMDIRNALGALFLAMTAYVLVRYRNTVKFKTLARGLNNPEQVLAFELEKEQWRQVALQAANDNLNEMIMVSAHQLRSPLNRIQTAAEIIAQDPAAPDLGQWVTMLNESVDIAKVQLDGLTDLYAISSIGDVQDVDTGQVVKAIANDLTISGCVQIAGPMPIIRANQGLITTLFYNLISNAKKFAAADRPLEIIVSRQGNTFIVSDNGIGINNDYIDEIFIVFRRLHGQSDYPGRGIGLAQVRRIAEHYDGSVTATSTEGEGSTFYVSFPAKYFID